MFSKNFLLQWKRYLPILGLILFVYILYRIDLRLLFPTLKKVDYKLFLVLPVILFFLFAIQTVRLNMILATRRIRLPFWYLYGIQLIGVFYGTITPSKIGSILRIGYIAERAKCTVSQCSTSVIIERFLDTLVLLLFALSGGFLIVSHYNLIIYQVSGIIVLLVGLALLFHKKERAQKVGHFFYRYFPKNYKHNDLIKSAFNDFYDYMPRKRETIIPFLLSILNWTILYSINYLIALALGIELAYQYFIFLYPIATIVGMLPITFVGLGIRETVLLTLFHNLISPVEVISISMLSLALCGIAPALIGWLLSISYQKHKI